jgi:hypothetical protein
MEEVSTWLSSKSDGFLVAHALMYAPFVALALKQFDSSAALSAWSRAHLEKDDWTSLLMDLVLKDLHARLSDEDFAATWARGKAMDAESALALARQLADG